MAARQTIHFIANGIFSTSVAGGDMVYFNLAQAASQSGYAINHFGGHAFQKVAAAHNLPGTITLTDDTMIKVQSGLAGQFALLRDFYGRYRRTLALQQAIQAEDIVCATSDYWFDVVPVVRCFSSRKMMVLNMEAPSLLQIITRGRPDVDATRLAALHYWMSQEWSLRRFASCRRRHMIYLHPLMERRLDHLCIQSKNRTLISYGLDPVITDVIPSQTRVYDVVWIGRVHRQKGVDDLLSTLKWLSGRMDDFRAIFIGNVREKLLPLVQKFGLEKNIEFSGFVSEEEKIRLFKASRVFLMPSKHEGSPRVIGESIIARTPVVAYEIPNYPPLFKNLVRYVPPFDLMKFQSIAEREILRMRAGENYLEQVLLEQFRLENSWTTAGTRFLTALAQLNEQK